MILHLHCGFHKTGSSYLQSCFASQKEMLGKHRIFYPDDPRQSDAAMGRPTAGNGALVADALLKSDPERCRSLLKRYAAQAKAASATAVLLSTEGFFSAFSREQGLKMLVELAREAGFKVIRALTFFRDPVEHVISVYCHRAASGKLPAFKEWLENRFETPGLMRSFAGHHARFPVEWQFHRFQPMVRDITTVAFADWLQIAEKPDLSKLPQQVNVSISISEAEVLRLFHARFPDCGRHLSECLKTLKKSQKADETELRRHYEDVAVRWFQNHRDTIDAINQLLTPDQPLRLSTPSDEPVPMPAPLLSASQTLACAQGLIQHRRSRSPLSRLKRFFRRIKQQIQRSRDS